MGSQQQFHSKTFQPKPAPPIQTASLTPRPFGNTHDTPTSALDDTPNFQTQLDLLRRRPSNLHRITPDIPKATIQPKLTVGAPNDQYEQEADRVADQVMSMPDRPTQPPIQRETAPEEEELQTKPLAASITPLVQREAMPEEEEVQAKAVDNSSIQREEMPEEEEVQTKAIASIQREEMPEEEVQTKAIASIQREEMPEEEEVQMKAIGTLQREEMPEEEEVQTKAIGTLQREEMPEEELQMKPIGMLQREEAMPEEEEVQAKPLGNSIQREAMPEEEELQAKPLGSGTLQREAMPEEEEAVQAKGAPDAALPAGSNLESRLSSSQGGGSPLPNDVRSFMEPRFGADFSGVRVHTGSDAVQMNRDLNAQAFTHKQDVYFGSGKAPAKDGLTAHELTHVVQQTQSIRTKITKTSPIIQLSPVPEDSRQDSRRKEAAAFAKEMEGKVSAKEPVDPESKGKKVRKGWEQLQEFFDTATGREWKEIPTYLPRKGQKDGLPSWCGIFALWALKKAGADVGKWVQGQGVHSVAGLYSLGEYSDKVQIGDVGYMSEMNDHHFIVVDIQDGGTLEIINGNGGEGGVGGLITKSSIQVERLHEKVDETKYNKDTKKREKTGKQTLRYKFYTAFPSTSTVSQEELKRDEGKQKSKRKREKKRRVTGQGVLQKSVLPDLQEEVIQRAPPKQKSNPEVARVAKLERDYAAAVKRLNWNEAARFLNGFNDDDILIRVQNLKQPQLSNIYQSALRSMPGWSDRVTKPIAQQYPEIARVAKLNFDYETSVNKGDWGNAARYLNGFDDNDIFRKIAKLNDKQRQALEAEAVKIMPGWAGRVTDPIDKVNKIASDIGVPTSWLMAVIGFETSGTYSTSKKNAAGSGAVGLIQFMPKTAKALGTTTAALAKMTPLQQLDYVDKHFKSYRGKIKTFTDMYMAVLWPTAIGKGDNYVIFVSGTTNYSQNSGLDTDKDGKITAGEAAAQPKKFIAP